MQLNSGKAIVKKSLPLSSILLILTTLFFITSIATSYTGWIKPLLKLNENQVLYLFSTSSQVISAIYGLTLTGLIFFINELNREQIEDETKEASTRELKSRYYYFLLFITAMVCASIGIGNGVISTEAQGPGAINSILLNTGQAAFAFSLIAIVIFIFEVIDPKALERASERVKDTLDPFNKVEKIGSLEEFMRNFNQVEGILIKYGDDHAYSDTPSLQARPRRRLSNVRLAEILFRNKKIEQPLFNKVRELISLRNSIVHGADPVVSETIVKNSSEVLDSIKIALEIG